MPITVIDSDILIDFTRGDSLAVAYLETAETNLTLAISQMTEMELIVGSRNKEHLKAIKHFLGRFQLININDQISSKSSELIERYCLSHGLRIADAGIVLQQLTLMKIFKW